MKPTGEYYSKEFAWESPREKGKFLIPAGCVTIEPPKVNEKEVPVFDRSKKQWVIFEDHRGEKLYNKETKEEFVVTAIGKLPAMPELTDKKPSEEPYIIWDEKSKDWIVDQEEKEQAEMETKISNLKEIKTLEAILADNDLTEKEIAEINKKINELKGITSEKP